MADARPESKQRALPTPRDEGMANVLAAAKRLLLTNSPKDVTLRDVARESGHAPRLIIAWFGGKGGLFAAVCETIFADLNSTGQLFYSDVALRPDVAIAFKLLNYMQMMHPEETRVLRRGIVQEHMKARFQEKLGKSPEEAEVIARRLSALSLGLVLFSDMLGLTDDDIIAMIQNEFRATTGFEAPDNPNRKRTT